MKKKEGFILRDVCGEKVIIGEGLNALDFGKMISMNETAAWLWEHAEGDFHVNGLVEELCEEYNVDTEKARHDVTKIVSDWKKMGIIEE